MEGLFTLKPKISQRVQSRLDIQSILATRFKIIFKRRMQRLVWRAVQFFDSTSVQSHRVGFPIMATLTGTIDKLKACGLIARSLFSRFLFAGLFFTNLLARLFTIAVGQIRARTRFLILRSHAFFTGTARTGKQAQRNKC